MATINAYGEGNVWNIAPSDLTLSDILVSIRSTSAIFYGSIPEWSVEFEMHGSFSYTSPVTDATSLYGSATVIYVYVDGYLTEIDQFTDAVDVRGMIEDAVYEASLYSAADVFEGSASTDVRDFARGLNGNDRFVGHGDDSYGDFFHGGNGVDTAVYEGERAIQLLQIPYMTTSPSRTFV